MLQLGPEAYPVSSPENNLQNRIELRFFENYIIPTFSNGLTNGSDTNQIRVYSGDKSSVITDPG
jgi:hypothetical protein